MTTWRYIEIACDFCRMRDAEDHAPTAKDARLRLHQDGWHYSHGRDICPGCWKDGHR